MNHKAVEQAGDWRPKVVWGLCFIVLAGGLAGLELSFRYGWGFLPDDKQLELMIGASFGLSGITVAVVGLLLSIWVAQKIYEDVKRRAFFRLLILSLTGGVVLGFSAGICGLAVLGGSGGQDLKEAVPYLFLATPYFITLGVVGSVLAILWTR